MLRKKEILRIRAEKEIKNRLIALRRYLRSPAKDPHLSLEEIFRRRESTLTLMTDPLKRLIQKVRSRKNKPVEDLEA